MEMLSSSNKDRGEFLGLSPKSAFFTGLFGGVLVLCAAGFFILLGLTLKQGGILNLKPGSVANAGTNVATTTDSTTTNPTTTAPTDTTTASIKNMPPVTDHDHIFGDPTAKVTLVEYSDYECPFCKQFEPTVSQLMQEYKGKVRLVYRHFPLSFHQNAEKEAEAGECVAELGGNAKFWDFTTKIFERTTSNGTGFALQNLPALAAEVGVNQTKFEGCLNSGKYATQITQSEQGGEAAGITGTPGTIVLNDKGQSQLIPGAIDYAQLKSIVDSLL